MARIALGAQDTVCGWMEIICIGCGNIRKIYTNDPVWLFIREHKNCTCEKCNGKIHNVQQIKNVS